MSLKTDKEILVDLYTRNSISFKVKEDDKGWYDLGEDCRVVCEAQTPGVIGYSCFVAEHYFDKDGKLVGVGAWE